jgi:rubrerythrin
LLDDKEYNRGSTFRKETAMSIYVLECEECGRISLSQDNKTWSGWSLDETAKQNSHHSEADFDTVEECPVCKHHKEEMEKVLQAARSVT